MSHSPGYTACKACSVGLGRPLTVPWDLRFAEYYIAQCMYMTVRMAIPHRR